jgi:hypothetical protein
MAECVRCHKPFAGTPWRYGPDGREHVDCDAEPYREYPVQQHARIYNIGPGAPKVYTDRTRGKPPRKKRRKQRRSAPPRRPRPTPLRQRKGGWSRPFVAKFKGSRCSNCGFTIEIGAEAQLRNVDEGVEYRHLLCP